MYFVLCLGCLVHQICQSPCPYTSFKGIHTFHYLLINSLLFQQAVSVFQSNNSVFLPAEGASFLLKKTKQKKKVPWNPAPMSCDKVVCLKLKSNSQISKNILEFWRKWLQHTSYVLFSKYHNFFCILFQHLPHVTEYVWRASVLIHSPVKCVTLQRYGHCHAHYYY